MYSVYPCVSKQVRSETDQARYVKFGMQSFIDQNCSHLSKFETDVTFKRDANGAHCVFMCFFFANASER